MDELIKQAAKSGDDLLKFGKWIPGIGGVVVENLDRPLLKALFEKGDEATKGTEFEDEYKLFLEAIAEGDFSKLSDSFASSLAQAIDIPGLDDEEDKIVFTGIFGIILKIADKRMRDNGQSNASSESEGGEGEDEGNPGGGPKEGRD